MLAQRFLPWCRVNSDAVSREWEYNASDGVLEK